MKSKILLTGVLILGVLAGCKKDNQEAPKSTLTGRIVYQGQPLSVRSNGVQLELWQPGYAFYTKIPIYVDQDGSFSAALFNGDYKLTRLKSNGPWADKTDTININVNGSANVDVEMDPYFIFKNENFSKAGAVVNATFNLQRVNTTKNLELVKIYIGRTAFTDQNFNDANVSKLAAAITDLSQPITLSVNIPASLVNNEYVYARVGVKTVGVAEYLYTLPRKIMLK